MEQEGKTPIPELTEEEKKQQEEIRKKNELESLRDEGKITELHVRIDKRYTPYTIEYFEKPRSLEDASLLKDCILTGTIMTLQRNVMPKIQPKDKIVTPDNFKKTAHKGLRKLFKR